MSHLFSNFLPNLAKIFSGKNLVFHGFAIALTFVFVATGLDWQWFRLFHYGTAYRTVFFGAGFLGFIAPVAVPLSMLAIGKMRKNVELTTKAWVVGQAALLGLLISFAYKFFTGRPGPGIGLGPLADTSTIFNFGLYRGGVFWGWPSSHTLVAFAAAITLVYLYPQNKAVKYLALLYAIYIGFGASIGFHWLSDCLAAAIMGTVVGITVAKSFKTSNH
jgi:membrane-associated phospholipid phosphatase